MIPELGHFSLILALALALLLATLPLYGAFVHDLRLVGMARALARGHFVFVAFAFGALAWSFMNNDFSVLNVASNSNSHLPLHYRFAATWGSHEGSLLLWVLMLSIWMLGVTVFSRNLPEEMRARVLAVMAMISIGFLLFLLFTSNPFERQFPAALEGSDLNPLLQDPGMVIHPPMLYMGYVGFSVAFAFAIAALLGGRLDATWVRWSRPWTTAAWAFLTVGIALGSAWAYYELGWGGWWFWDPVENASFMPWLAGTALIHSQAVTEKRGSFKSWTVLLAIVAFSLSLLGTFLVRSGVLTSVHAFATDPTRGVFILGFLGVVIGSSLALYAWRAPKVGMGIKFELLSRESMLLANNVVLVVALATVVLGTLSPLILAALDHTISVGPPYFNLVFFWLMLPGLFLLALGPVTRWRMATAKELWQKRKWHLGISLVVGIVGAWMSEVWSLRLAIGLFLASWIITSSVTAVWARLWASSESSWWAKLRRQSPSFLGMHVAHIGVAIFIIGVGMVSSAQVEEDVVLAVGGETTVAGLQFRFTGVSEFEGPNYHGLRGRVEVSRDGKLLTVLSPEKHRFIASGQMMTEAAIRNRILGDIYVSMGEPLDNGAWGFRIYIKPFVDWIWAGCFIMAFGGALALADRRYRMRRRVDDAVPTEPVARSASREAPPKPELSLP